MSGRCWLLAVGSGTNQELIAKSDYSKSVSIRLRSETSPMAIR